MVVPIFMHDGTPCHRSKVVPEYLTKSKVAVFDRPGNTFKIKPNQKLVELQEEQSDRKATIQCYRTCK